MIDWALILRVGYLAIVVVVTGYLIGIAVYFLLRLLLGDRHWILSFLNNTSIYVLLPLIIVTPVTFLLKNLPLSLAASSFWLLSAIWLSPYFLPRSQAASGAPKLRVISFNMWGGNPQQNDITGWIRQLDTDIVFLQEVPDSYANSAFPNLKDIYPHQYRQETEMRWWSNAVLSKYPIESITVVT